MPARCSASRCSITSSLAIVATTVSRKPVTSSARRGGLHFTDCPASRRARRTCHGLCERSALREFSALRASGVSPTGAFVPLLLAKERNPPSKEKHHGSSRHEENCGVERSLPNSDGHHRPPRADARHLRPPASRAV